MAYVKPGVTVKQVQTTVSPSFAPPSLSACIIGEGYYVVESTENNAKSKLYETSALVSGLLYDDSGVTGYLNIPDDTELEEDSVYVEMLNTLGDYKYISSDYFTADNSANTVVISGGLLSSVNSYLQGASIRVGFRAKKSALNSYFVIDSLDSVEEKVGKAVTYNPLAFGLKQALTNAGASVAAYGVTEDTENAHIAALDDLSLQEVYALAPMTWQKVSDEYTAHVEDLSGEYKKKERIAFVNNPWTWFDDSGNETTGPLDEETGKNGTVRGLSAVASAVQNKRVFYINPDTCYVRETRPVATVKQSYLKKAHSKIDTYGLYAKFTNRWVYKPGTTSEKIYYAGDNITDEVWNRLVDNTYGYFATTNSRTITVDVPVSAYYVAAAIAGQVSGQRPEQGFTNLPIAGGVSSLKYSGDYFSEEQLNTLAGGGNWVMWQANSAAPIITRHQLSTDVSSIELQELSITKSLDFAAKFIREGVSPYIGKYNITPAFLGMLKSIIVGQGAYLRREGYVNDVRVDKVEQDAVSKDTILVTISISVQYPVNYIKITLQF